MRINKMAKIQFYKIDECGYYDSQNRFSHCNIWQLLDGLSEWSKNKPIGHTMTFEPIEDTDQNKVYCYDLFHSKQYGSSITTWNATPLNSNDQIAAINITQHLGTEDIETSNFSPEYTPGYDTYFWFPNKNLPIFATVRFDKRTQNGMSDLKIYLDNFLRYYHPSYVFDGRENESDGCFYYGENSLEINNALNPKFKASRVHLPGKLDEIRRNRKKITKVIRKACVKPLQKDSDRGLLEKVLYFITGESDPIIREEFINLETRTNIQPTEKQLESMISAWQKRTSERSETGRVGVIYRGDQNVQWFDWCFAKGDFLVNVDINKHGIVIAESLAKSLYERTDEILSRTMGEI